MKTDILFERHLPISYEEALLRQEIIFADHLQAVHSKKLSPSYVMMCEHEPVLTLGKHADPNNILSPDILKQRGIKQYRIARGGDVTFHGPGQLVVYPIMNLLNHQLGVKTYVELLQNSVIELLKEWEIEAYTLNQHPGVWVKNRQGKDAKICALGIYCHHYITMHGIALNVNTSMDYFSLICPCGIRDKEVTSLSAIVGQDVSLSHVADRFQEIFIRLLS